ncbi:MAG: cytochrome C554, partial [Myxococcales bacterium]|nr:cytochrome C554 [Myxococcales bacterium]
DVPFVVANVDIAGFLPTFRVSEVAGRKIGVTSVLGNSHRDRVTDDDLLSVRDAAEALREVRTELVNASCDWYVLLAHASIEESEELARTFPEFDIVVTAGGAGEPTYQPTKIEGSEAVLVQVGTKGMYAGVIGLYEDTAQPIKYQRIALDGTWSDSVAMLRLLAGYQQQLEALQLNGLELHPVVHPSGRQFVGSDKCGECHTKAFDKWVETPHSHATETLVHPPERYEVPRHFDPECLSCHVTGWNAQGYYPYRSGYVELKASQHLRGNGCENCHGPGSKHVAAEEGESDLDDDQLEALRDQMKLAMADAKENCLQCHDIDNSPDFHVEEAFEKEYWPAIEHIGKD